MIESVDAARASLAAQASDRIQFDCAFAQKVAARAGVWSVSQPDTGGFLMTITSTTGTFEECADELNDFVATLQRYPHTVLAFALRAHLCGLLQALQAHEQWSGTEARTFLEELAHEALQSGPDAAESQRPI
jgi:hypothetical protein